MFEVIPKRTMPQGLLLLSASFSCAMIALSQLMMVAMPTYSTYGSQHYSEVVNGTSIVKACDSHAPQGNGCFYKPSAHNTHTENGAVGTRWALYTRSSVFFTGSSGHNRICKFSSGQCVAGPLFLFHTDDFAKIISKTWPFAVHLWRRRQSTYCKYLTPHVSKYCCIWLASIYTCVSFYQTYPSLYYGCPLNEF